MISFIAQNPTPLSATPISGIGPLGGVDPSRAPEIFAGTISRIIGVLTVVAILWFVFQIIIGAYGWISAGGDAKSVEAARSRITNAVIGLIVVFVALIFVSVIGFLLGIGNILDIGTFINNLTPGTN
ncbi:hypothetical protein CMO96_04990 [Candidatus Woesebacteria bacterium]|nr:hypothetical protein [Candidatus Woesebacteria bacterium]